MLQNLIRAGVLIACGAAVSFAVRESWRPSAERARWAGRIMTVASFLVLLDWVALLARDAHLVLPAAWVWVTVVDCVIILGIAWIPCFLLLQVAQPGLRTASYLAGCAAALVWIGWHTPTHAIPPQAGADTVAMTVAVPLIGFAFLNLALIVPRARKAAQAMQVRLAWGTATAAWGGTLGFVAVGVWRAGL